MGAIKSLFGTPKAAPVIRMPDKEDPAAIEARKRELAKVSAGSGRASTNLTGTGGSYVSDKLGL
jgi:hypothetical protein